MKMILKKTDSTNLSNMISNRPGTSLELVTKMTVVTDRINLKSARSIFNSVRYLHMPQACKPIFYY